MVEYPIEEFKRRFPNLARELTSSSNIRLRELFEDEVRGEAETTKETEKARPAREDEERKPSRVE